MANQFHAVIRAFAVALLAMAALGSARVEATNVTFGGSVGYSYSGSTANLTADRVQNNSSTASGTLKLELWALSAPYTGSAVNGHKLAQYTMGALQGGYYYADVDSGNVPFTAPPNGTYYLTLLVTEYTGAAVDSGYTPTDYVNFDDTATFGPSGPPPPSVSPQVGLWWNPAESGSGYAFDYKHGVLVVTVYSYDTDGTPLWYIVSGPVSGTTFSGTLNRTTGGQCISCAYHMPVISGNDGTMTIVFSSNTAGTMYLPGGRAIPVIPQAF